MTIRLNSIRRVFYVAVAAAALVCFLSAAAGAERLERRAVRAGWDLVSVPDAADETNLCEIVAGGAAVFDFQGGGYRSCRSGRIMLEPGRAYWVWFPGDTEVDFPRVDGAADSSVALRKGWNLIGAPGDAVVLWSDVTFLGGVSCVEAGPFRYDRDSGGYASATLLEPWRGYAVLASGSCDMLFPGAEAVREGIAAGPVEISGLIELPGGARALPGQIVARKAEGTSDKDFFALVGRAGGRVAGYNTYLGLYQIELAAGADVEAAAAELGASAGVEAAAPNIVFSVGSLVPNDPPYAGGAAETSWAFLKIGAPAVWDRAGAGAPVIAVVDTGVDAAHADLAGRVTGGANFIDPAESAETDENGHGTHAAGIAAAAGGNGLGVAGVCWNCRVMPEKVCDANGQCPFFSVMNGITHAANSGADVINISLTAQAAAGSPAAEIFQAVVDYAAARGALIVAAAGNGGVDAAGVIPASLEKALAVGATDVNDARAAFSNFGAAVDIAAPGAGIYSLEPGGGAGFRDGTSAAAAFVSGAAGFVLGLQPTMTAEETAALLGSTAAPVASAEPLGAGRLDLAAIYEKLYPSNRAPEITEFSVSAAEVGAGGAVIAKFDAKDSDGDPIDYEWTVSGGALSTDKSTEVVWTLPTTPGVYTARVAVSDGRGGNASREGKVSAGAAGLFAIEVRPAAMAMKQGESSALYAFGVYMDGGVVPISPEWKMDAPLGVVNGPSFTATAEGEGKLTASFGGRERSITVLVNADGSFPALSIAGFGGAGQLSNSILDEAVAVGDLNGDSLNDVVIGRYGATNTVYLNNAGSPGTFTSNQDFGTGAYLANTSFLELGDIDRDGDLDLVESGYGQGWHVYRNAGGTLSYWQTLGAGVKAKSGRLADADNDGDLDLFAANADSGQQSYIFINDGGGNFTTTKNVGIAADVEQRIEPADLDYDGDMDFVVINHAAGVDRVYFNDGSANFVDSGQAIGGTNAGAHATLADVSGDGRIDLVVSDQSDECLRVFTNNGSGVFTDTGGCYKSVPDEWFYFTDAADFFDNDGDYDLVTAPDVDSQRVFTNSGAGAYPASQGPYGSGVKAVRAGDLDNDGNVDFANAANVAGATEVYINDQAGSQSAPTAPGGLASSVPLSDVTLSWNAGTDAETGGGQLTYDLRVGTASGGNQTFSGVVAAGPGNVLRPLVGGPLKHVLKGLPNGTYYWSVRTVDSQLRRSAWAAEQTFIVANLGPLATCTVNSNADTNTANTLRFCINQANANLGYDTIDFSISNTTINITGPPGLPDITEAVNIDASGRNIKLVGSPGTYDCFIVRAGGTVANPTIIRGFLAIKNFDGGAGTPAAVLIDVTTPAKNGYITVRNNVLGREDATDVGWENQYGVKILGGASTIAIGPGNTIGKNKQDGILINTTTNNVQVKGNYIGTLSTGSGSFGNTKNGINVLSNTSGETLIGGLTTTAGECDGDCNVISWNGINGILVSTPVDMISGNFIGLERDGTTQAANSSRGINITGVGAYVDMIGGTTTFRRNVIGGNVAESIYIDSATTGWTAIQGNFIGVKKDGISPITGAPSDGINLQSAQKVLIGTDGNGTTDSAEGNVISGNREGILVSGGSSIIIAHNRIGPGADGTTPVGNTADGIYVLNSSNLTIGGDIEVEGNMISWNTNSGIWFFGNISSTTIRNNVIGIAGSATTSFKINTGSGANSQHGLYVQTAAGAMTTTTIQDNIISNNNQNGIYFLGSNVTSTTIKGNKIGVDNTGTAAPNMLSGIKADGSFSGNTIGGTAAGESNTIAGNWGGDGILLDGAAANLNKISGNSIYSNSGKGISLTNGSQGGITRPTISNITGAGPFNITVTFACPTATCSIELFCVDNPPGGISADATAGEGWKYLTSASSGASPYTFNNVNVAASCSNTTKVTATLRSTLNNNTSEFANNYTLPAAANNPPTVSNVTFTPNTRPADGASATTVTATVADLQGLGDISSVTINLTGIGGGAAVALYDNATNGDTVAGDGVYTKNSITVAIGTALGAKTITVTATDVASATGTASGTLTVINSAPTVSNVTFTPNTVVADASTTTKVTATVADLQGLGTISSVKINLTGIGGGASTTLYDNGSNGDTTSGDGIYSLSGITVAYGTAAGAKTITVTATDSSSATGTATGTLTVTAICPGWQVTTNANTGIGSLRYCILEANKTTGANTITFNGNMTITPTSILPALADTTGGTTLTASATQTVTIDGNGAAFDGITITSSNNVVSGLRIIRFNGGGGDRAGIRITGIVTTTTGNQVKACYIGNNGAVALGNSFGVIIEDGAANNTVGGTTTVPNCTNDCNVISGNRESGVLIQKVNSNNNTVSGNYIGLNPAGTATMGTQKRGVMIYYEPESNTIGGATSDRRNVISGNSEYGVALTGINKQNNVYNNYIGTDKNGTAAVANGTGVYLSSDGSGGAQYDRIGGNGLSNIIAYNTNIGVYVDGPSADNDTISRNRIFGNTNAGGNANGGGIVLDPITAGGANNVIQRPTITNVALNGANYDVTGAIACSSPPCTVELFRVDDSVAGVSGDTTGYGQAYEFIAATSTSVGAFSFINTPVNANGTKITATVTDSASNTSMFAANYSLECLGYVVTSNADSGLGSLRKCIEAANNSGGANMITFNATMTITPLTQLPALTDNSGLTIDGGATHTVVIDGNGASFNGLVLSSDANTIKNLTIVDFTGADKAGVRLDSGADNNSVKSCKIGNDGAAAQGNYYGVYVVNGTGNTIGGSTTAPNCSGDCNIISGNTQGGVVLYSASALANTVSGNFVGTSATGAGSLANSGKAGVWVYDSRNNTIGGVTSAARNVISGNTNVPGVMIQNSGATGNTVAGNYIGTTAAGSAILMNDVGVDIEDAATSNTIGGTTTLPNCNGSCNVISGNDTFGVMIQDANTNSNSVKGNFIGLNAAGTGALPNTAGVGINTGAISNRIGGAVAGEGNVISGNITGVQLNGASGTVMYNNYIGLRPDGTTAQANTGASLSIISDAKNSVIGGTAANQANRIANGGVAGVSLDGAGTDYNKISGNSIYTNAGDGINLANLANDGLLSPVITCVSKTGVNQYSVQGTKCNNCTVELFRADNTAAPVVTADTAGEGYAYLTNDATAGMSFTKTVTVTSGKYVSGTAIDTTNNTSEFGTSVDVTPATPTVVSVSFSPTEIKANGAATTTVTAEVYDPNGLCDISTVTINLSALGGSATAALSYSGVSGVNAVYTRSGITAATGTAGATYTLTVRATDAAGLYDDGTGTLKVNSPPSVSIDSLAPNPTTDGSTVTVSVTVTDDNGVPGDITSVTIDLTPMGGSAAKALTSGGGGTYTATFTASSTAALPQTVALIVTVTDSKGQTGSDTDNLTISSNAPSVTSVTFNPSSLPPDGVQTTTVTAVVGDPQGLADIASVTISLTNIGGAASVTLYDNATNGDTTAGDGNYMRSGLTVAIGTATGTKTLMVTATDLGANTATNTGSLTVTTMCPGFVVSSSSNSGAYTLRECINEANTTTGAQTIYFSGSMTITPTSALPALTDATGATTIDGATNTVVIDGNGGAFDGITINSDGNTIKNLTIYRFSAANRSGILISGGADNNTIKGCKIGNDGTNARANAYGISITSGTGNTLGGSAAADRNVISGNSTSGVYITGAGSTSNNIYGNYIGLNASGTAAIANSRGIDIWSSAGSNKIGGTTAGQGNYISGNTGVGIYVDGSNGTTVYGNYFGVRADGVTAQANGVHNITFANGASNSTVGGTAANQANVIANSSAGGILFDGASTDFNKASGNSIYSNAGEGISLQGGANDSLAAPVISCVTRTGVNQYSARGTKCNNCTVELFKADNTAAPVVTADTAGEGYAYLTNDATAGTSFTKTVTVTNGKYLSATAIDTTNNTSEFSTSVDVTPATPTVVSVSFSPTEIKADGAATTTVTAEVFDPNGLCDISAVTIDLSALGGSAAAALSYSGVSGVNAVYTRSGITAAIGTPGATYTLTVKATDAAGLFDEGTGTLKVNSPPTVTLVTFNPDPAANGGTVTAIVTVTDDNGVPGDISSVTINASPAGGPASVALAYNAGTYRGTFTVSTVGPFPKTVTLTATATDSKGQSDTGTGDLDIVDIGPKPPAPVSAVSSGGNVLLQWTSASQDTGNNTILTPLSGHNIYRRDPAGSYGAATFVDNTSTATNTVYTYTDNTVTVYQQYCYVLTTLSGSGVESLVSAEVCLTPEPDPFRFRKTCGNEGSVYLPPSTPGVFNRPMDVTADGLGFIYVADMDNHRVQKLDEDCNFIKLWGTPGNGSGQFKQPTSITYGNGEVYVIDGYNRVQVFDTNGVYKRSWTVQLPVGIEYDEGSGNVYVSSEYDKVYVYQPNGTPVKTFSGTTAARHMDIDASGNMYYANSFSHKMRELDSSGAAVTEWGGKGVAYGKFDYPYGVALDSAGQVYVSETKNRRIQIFDAAGTLKNTIGESNEDYDPLSTPMGLTISSSTSRLFLCDANSNRLLLFDQP